MKSGGTSRLSEWIARGVLVGVSLFVASFVVEMILSIPRVATRLLPPAFVKNLKSQWEQQNYDRLWEKNPQGFRSFHLDEPKGKGTFRIVTLGDSFTWGGEIASTTNIWPCVLEEHYRKKGAPLEVVNLAISGFTTVNEVEMLERFGWKYQPDLVVVGFYLNDPLPSGTHFRRKGESWMQDSTWPLLPFFHQTLNEESYFYSLVNQRFSRWQLNFRHLRNWDYNDLFKDDFFGWKDCQAALKHMGEECKKRKVLGLVVIFPCFQGSLEDQSYRFPAIHEKTKRVVEDAGLWALDLRPIYAKINPDGKFWWAIPVDMHPGIEAHRVAAQAIAEELDRRGVSRNWIRNGSKR